MRIIMHAGLLVAVDYGGNNGDISCRASFEAQVLRDGDGAKTMRFDNMHQVRFIELFLAGREAKTGKMVAACYNTMYTSER